MEENKTKPNKATKTKQNKKAKYGYKMTAGMMVTAATQNYGKLK